MSTHKGIDRICVLAVVLCMILSRFMMTGEAAGAQDSGTVMGYEDKLFDTASVHTVEIEMEDWESFLATCESEEYSVCNVTIDGESFHNVAIRGKGNTSLSNVSAMNSDRYSFKVEFDHYDSSISYHGLDKLSLNNIIQDNTYMKDYLVYQMMQEFGVTTPLCSFVYITVNGEDWGLYLAVEGVEESFLQRNYGNNYGELYKPDSLSMGGMGNMEMPDLSEMENVMPNMTMPGGESAADTETNSSVQSEQIPDMGNMTMPEGFDPSFMGEGMTMPEGFDPSAMGEGMTIPEGFDPSAMGGNMPTDEEHSDENSQAEEPSSAPAEKFNFSGAMGNMPNMGGMGSSDVKLQYIDDDPDSYGNIFDNAKTDITEADKNRLIAALKSLSEQTDLKGTVNIEEVIRYFVVHNFVCNGDSYTGSMVHNYYLYEEDGRLSMIPWDYNLAFGTFRGGNATDTVNEPIDTPVSGGTEDRPMVDWIFAEEDYTELYHQYFAEFLETVDISKIIDDAYTLISEYVERDPTKFCTYEEFKNGVATLKEFVQLRTESVSGQLDGTIPSTEEGQKADTTSFIDASSITLSDMGSMMSSMGFGGMEGGKGQTDAPNGDSASEESADTAETQSGGLPNRGGFQMPDGMEIPEDMDFSNMTFPGENNQQSTVDQTTNWILLVASAVVLLLGLLIAFKYHR